MLLVSMKIEELFRNVSSQVSDEEAIELLRDTIRIPSHVDHPGREGKIVEFLKQKLESEGIEVDLQEVTEGRHNVIGTVHGSGSGKSLMLVGHVDTKPPYNMTIEPYDPVIKDGKVYGRGSCDMKAGLIAEMLSLVAVKRAGLELKGDLIFAGTVGEEISAHDGGIYLAQHGPRADMAIVAEPTSLKICRGHKGITNVEIKTIGKAIHSSVPDKGINAIVKMAKLILKIEEEIPKLYSTKRDELLGLPTAAIDVISGGREPAFIPDLCKIIINVRTVPGQSGENIRREFEEIIEKVKQEDPEFKAELTLSDFDHMPPYSIPKNHEIIRVLKEATKSVTGYETEVFGAPYFTDGAYLAVHANIPTVIYGPGDIAQAHSAVEYVSIKEFLDALRIFTLTALKICY